MFLADRKAVEKAIVDGIDSTDLRPFQKLRLRNIMENPRRASAKENLIDRMLLKMEEGGDLVDGPDGVAYARDWAAFFDLVMKYLPMILKLFGL